MHHVLRTYRPGVGENKSSDEEVDKIQAELADLGSVSNRRQLPDNKVVEDIDELAKDKVHERQDCAAYDHGEESDRV